MSSFQVEERNKIRRHLVDQAIALAMQNRWADAVKINQQILDIFPEDTDALNRLGRSQMELGHYRDARDAYQRTVHLDPSNTIARKNLTRLASLKVEEAPPSGEKVDPRMFIAETGKTGVVTLSHPAPKDVLAKLSAGDQVNLRVDGRILMVESLNGNVLGLVDPKIGQRLIDLMRSGNKYTAAVMAMDDGNLRLFIRETFQDPNNTGKVSFPIRGEGPGIRAYTRETLLKYELEEEEDSDSDDGDFGEREEEPEEPLEVADMEDDHGAE
jgi:tetratricopeptide (TPR) repeat protein